MKNIIKDVSIDLFYKKGYFATGISDIARATGIQKSSIYYHYSNKEDIIFDILKTTMIDLDVNLEQQLKNVTGAESRMRVAVQSHIIFHIERQKEVIISDSELRGLTVDNYRTILGMRDQYERKFQALIQRGIEEGIFSENDVKILSYAILTLCTSVCIWFRPAGRLSKEEVADIYIDFILRGLKRGNIHQTS
ncbi:MAG: TetR family transcriptional regulator [Deltaproteobacteria bacterium]|nr:TetR family transcriptional regulator [Deltaproteobacteria bacterium]